MNIRSCLLTALLFASLNVFAQQSLTQSSSQLTKNLQLPELNIPTKLVLDNSQLSEVNSFKLQLQNNTLEQYIEANRLAQIKKVSFTDEETQLFKKFLPPKTPIEKLPEIKYYWKKLKEVCLACADVSGSPQAGDFQISDFYRPSAGASGTVNIAAQTDKDEASECEVPGWLVQQKLLLIGIALKQGVELPTIEKYACDKGYITELIERMSKVES